MFRYERFALLDDEPAVAVDVAADGEDGDPAVGDRCFLEEGPRQPVEDPAVGVGDAAEGEIPVDAAAVYGLIVGDESDWRVGRHVSLGESWLAGAVVGLVAKNAIAGLTWIDRSRDPICDEKGKIPTAKSRADSS